MSCGPSHVQIWVLLAHRLHSTDRISLPAQTPITTDVMSHIIRAGYRCVPFREVAIQAIGSSLRTQAVRCVSHGFSRRSFTSGCFRGSTAPQAGGAHTARSLYGSVDASAAGGSAGFGRVLLGVLAGSAAMGTWVAIRPSFMQPSHFPLSGLLTFGLGAATFKFVAPRTTLLAFVGGLAILVPVSCAFAAAGALAKVNRSVTLCKADRETLRQEVQKYVELGKRAQAEGAKPSTCELEDPDEFVSIAIPMLKVAFYAICDDKDEETGELLLTPKRIRELRKSIDDSQCKSDDNTADTDGPARLPRNGEVPTDSDASHKLRKVLADPETFALQFMSLADVDHDNKLTFAEFASGVLLMAFADESPKLRNDVWFRTLDLNNDGTISRPELITWTKAMARAGALKPSDAVQSDSIFLRSAHARTAEEVADDWLARFASDAEGGISREEFERMAQEVDFSPIVPNRDWLQSFTKKTPKSKGDKSADAS